MKRFSVFVALLVGCTAIVADLCHGETRSLGSLPLNLKNADFMATVEIDVVAGDGYQPVYLKFKPLGRAFIRDHRVSVRISPRNNFVTSLDMAYDRAFVLPEGATQLQEIVYVPYYYPWDTISVTLFEEGRQIKTGRQSFHVGDLRTRDADQFTTVGVIIPHDVGQQDATWKKCPDVRTLITILGDGPLPEDIDVQRLSHKESLDLIQTVQPAWVQFRPINERELHATWLGFSQLDVIIVASPVLSRIETEQPRQFSALKDWIAAGGNLWSYGTPEVASDFFSSCDFKPVDASKITASKAIRQLLKLGDKNDTSDLSYEYYQGIQKRSQDYASRHLLDEMSTRDQVFKKMQSAKHAFATMEPPSSMISKMSSANFGLGTITSIVDEDPFPGSYQLWHSIANLHEPAQIKWVERNGVKSAQGNTNYWSWLIASVGKPPVKSFILLNTLFVVIIGPVAYFFFRRRERLYLLFFFAPAFALLVTLSLFGYAMLADGTATRLRTRQLTWIDTKHNTATTHSRQTYYAVLGSGKGLNVADDVAIFPVLHSGAVQRYQYHQGDYEPNAVFTTTPQLQNLSGAFLPARNQVQYATIHPNSIDGQLTFDLTADPPTITNDFPFAIRNIEVCNRDGQWWSSSKIESGATSLLQQTSPIDGIIDARVIPDPADVPMLSANRNMALVGDLSLLENKLMRWSKNLPPGHFVAEADLLMEELGVRDALINNSIHVIMGELP